MLYGTVYMKQFNIRISEDCNTFLEGYAFSLLQFATKWYVIHMVQNKDSYPVASRATGFKNQVAHSNFQVSFNSQVHAMDHYGVRRVLPGETVI